MNLKFEHQMTIAPTVTTTVSQVLLNYQALRGSVEISNDGDTNALTGFDVQCQDHPDGEFYTVLSGSDFGTPNDFMVYSSSNSPATLAEGTKAHLRLNLNGIFALRFQATSTSGTKVTVRGGVAVEPGNVT